MLSACQARDKATAGQGKHNVSELSGRCESTVTIHVLGMSFSALHWFHRGRAILGPCAWPSAAFAMPMATLTCPAAAHLHVTAPCTAACIVQASASSPLLPQSCWKTFPAWVHLGCLAPQGDNLNYIELMTGVHHSLATHFWLASAPQDTLFWRISRKRQNQD